jgi:hypothetical protein
MHSLSSGRSSGSNGDLLKLALLCRNADLEQRLSAKFNEAKMTNSVSLFAANWEITRKVQLLNNKRFDTLSPICELW